jgi:hypothetical protein
MDRIGHIAGEHTPGMATTLGFDDSNVAFVRTQQRIEAEEAMEKPETPKTRKDRIAEAYIEADRRERKAAADKRAKKIKDGTLIVHPDGSFTERIS